MTTGKTDQLNIAKRLDVSTHDVQQRKGKADTTKQSASSLQQATSWFATNHKVLALITLGAS